MVLTEDGEQDGGPQGRVGQRGVLGLAGPRRPVVLRRRPETDPASRGHAKAALLVLRLVLVPPRLWKRMKRSVVIGLQNLGRRGTLLANLPDSRPSPSFFSANFLMAKPECALGNWAGS